jgi:hypothetical protein
MPELTTAVRGGEGSRRRALPSAPAAVLVALLLLAAVTGGRSIAELPAPAEAAGGHARLVQHPSTKLTAARLARSAIAWTGGPTIAATGESVTVYVSPALAPELGTPQTWADFLAGLVHGPELSALSAYVATFAEMQGLCGEHALGCYTANRMVSIGETVHGVTAADVVRHEYGHHIAFHRLNPPWRAIDWGPKHWASSQSVCSRAGAGSAYPGDEGDYYSLNPGEAWAETYRLLDERKAGVAGSGWEIVDASFYPDETDFQAAERDVLEPWSSPRTSIHRNRFTAKSPRVWSIPLQAPLDGSIAVTAVLPKGGLHQVALVDAARKKVVAIALWAGHTVKKVVTNVCGQRALTLRITRQGAVGRVKVVAQIP